MKFYERIPPYLLLPLRQNVDADELHVMVSQKSLFLFQATREVLFAIQPPGSDLWPRGRWNYGAHYCCHHPETV